MMSGCTQNRWRCSFVLRLATGLLVAVSAAQLSGQTSGAAGTTTASVPAASSQPVSFEVASIKLNKSGSGGSSTHFNHGRFLGTNIGIKGLIQYEAYKIPEPQILGGPEWLNSERFDIEAKVDEATTAQLEKLGQEERDQLEQQLMQQLLADRFKLSVHWETKDQPVYALVVAKGGAKLTPAKDTSRNSGTSSNRGNLKATNVTMARLAETLTRIQNRELGRIVVDKTGIEGRYDLTLQWTPEDGSSSNASNDSGNSGPSIFTALQEQLGLKLESSKGPVKTLVIDHVEQPSEN